MGVFGNKNNAGSTFGMPHSAKIPTLVGILLGSIVIALGFSLLAVRCYNKKKRNRLYSNSSDTDRPSAFRKSQMSKSSSIVSASSSESRLPSSHSSQSLQPTRSSSYEVHRAINPAFVTDSSDAEGGLNPYLGSLYFTTEYDTERNTLLVTVLRVVDLPATAAGTADPYIKLQLLPEKKHRVKTRVLRKTMNPVYDETFTFYGVNQSELDGITLHFVALSFDRYSRDEVLGEVVYPLRNVDLSREVSVCKEITSRQIKLAQQGRGEILVSMCYQPAANRLTVVILKAKNLPKLDFTGLGDPFVKVHLLFEGKHVAKKKTHVRKRTLNPVYNESFVFDIPGEDLSSFGIELEVLNWDRMTRNETIGHVILSCLAEGTGKAHWEEVIENPRKQIAQGHKLE